MPRPTVKDIAKNAGVSLATVDRVLNGRLGVRKSTIESVFKTIDEIGYVRDIGAANLARKREYKLAFVLAEGDNTSSAIVENKINEIISGPGKDRMVLEIIKAPENDLHKVADILIYNTKYKPCTWLKGSTLQCVSVFVPSGICGSSDACCHRGKSMFWIVA